MEFVQPGFILTAPDAAPVSSGERLLPYAELVKLAPVKVDDFVTLNPGEENAALLARYLDEGLKLVPIVRRNVGFTPRDDFPNRVLLEITSRCNLDCGMCPRRIMERDKNASIPPETFRRCVDTLDAYGLNGLWLFYIGEPITHPQFPELLAYVSTKKNLGPIWISSNGRDLDEHFSRLIIESNLRYMNMSVNAASQESYNRIAANSDWERQIRNFHRFIDLKRASGRRTPFARVQMIDQAQTKDDMDQFLERYTGYADMLVVNNLEVFSDDMEQNKDYAEKRERPPVKFCNRVKRGDLFIFADGETTFCDSDYNGVFSMGNVNQTDIHTLWNGPRRAAMVALNQSGRLNDEPKCSTCLDYDL